MQLRRALRPPSEREPDEDAARRATDSSRVAHSVVLTKGDRASSSDLVAALSRQVEKSENTRRELFLRSSPRRPRRRREDGRWWRMRFRAHLASIVVVIVMLFVRVMSGKSEYCI